MATWIDVADSAVKIGLGAVAGGVVTLLLEHARRQDEREQRAEELRRSHFVDPIVAFLDGLMAAIGEVYWSHMDSREPRLAEKMAFFQERQGAVEARVLALADTELTELWQPFTRKVIEVRIRLGSHDHGDPYEKMKEAFDLGAKILRRLFDIRRK
jgi:hypothetical protein